MRPSLRDGGRLRIRPTRCLAAAVALAAAAGARAAPSQDPLEVRIPGTLRDLFLDVVPWDARSVPALRIDAGWTIANDWSTPTTLTRDGKTVEVRLDEQADSITAAVRVPWGVVLGSPPDAFLRRLATAVELRATVHWGGWTDPVIDAWHRLFAYNDFARPSLPSNEVHLGLHRPLGAEPVRIDAATFAFGDVVLRNQLLLWEGGEPLDPGGPARGGVSLRLDLKIPTGSLARMGGSGGWDVGLGVLGTWQATSWLTGHAIVSGSAWSGMPGGLPLQPRTWQASAGLALVVLLGDVSLHLEDRWASAPFQYGWAFVEVNPEWNLQSSASNAVTLSQNQIAGGVRWGPLTFWFAEDFTIGSVPGLGPRWFYDSNAPDVAFGLLLTLRP